MKGTAVTVHDPQQQLDGDGQGSPTGTAAVRVRGLWKRFGEQIAVAGIDLDVPAGRFIGLVGPNGAGKTTTLSMVTGLLRPDQGTVEVGGHDVWRDPVERQVPDRRAAGGAAALRAAVRPRTARHTSARLRGLPGDEVDKRATQLLDVLDLAGAQHKLVVDYSTGMRKKIGLAAALLHNPEVLFLDEPFEGVDPVSAQTIRGVLERYTASGATVVFSSHVMELVESLCDWVAVMAAGTHPGAGPARRGAGRRGLAAEAFLRTRRARTAATPGTASTGWAAAPEPPYGQCRRERDPSPSPGRSRGSSCRCCATGCGSPSGRTAAYVASIVSCCCSPRCQLLGLIAAARQRARRRRSSCC